MKNTYESMYYVIYNYLGMSPESISNRKKNSSPVTDRGHIIMIKHNTTEGWANGLLYKENPSSSIAAGIGAFGVGKNFIIYILE